MANMRKVLVRRIPPPGSSDPPKVLGHLVDNGVDEPFGTNQAVDDMLGQKDRRARFDDYFAGYSNGYVEWIDASRVG